MAGLVTRDEVVAAAKADKLIPEGDAVEWLEHAVNHGSWLTLDHLCGPPRIRFDAAAESIPISLLRLPLRRFADTDGRVAHAYVGRCDKCAVAFFVERN